MSHQYPFSTQFDDMASHFGRSVSNHQVTSLSSSEEDMQRVESDAYALGFDKGKRQGISESEQRFQEEMNQTTISLLGEISTRMNQIFQIEEDIQRAIDLSVLGVSKAILQKVVPSYVDQHGYQDIEKLIKSVLSSLFDKQKVVIRVPTIHYDKIKEYFDDMSVCQGHQIFIESSSDMLVHDCSIEWEGGGASISHAALLEKIDCIFNKHMSTFTDLKEDKPQDYCENDEIPESKQHEKESNNENSLEVHDESVEIKDDSNE